MPIWEQQNKKSNENSCSCGFFFSKQSGTISGEVVLERQEKKSILDTKVRSLLKGNLKKFA